MTDKVQKFLNKLRAEELEKIIKIVTRINAGDFSGLNVKPLRGSKGYFRIRVGRVRIICQRTISGFEVVSLSNRDEQTYRDY